MQLSEKKLIHAAAHITGGGLVENLMRSIPNKLSINIDLSKIKIGKIFKWIKSQNISDQEMMKTFNCGIGMILIVSPDHAADILKVLQDAGEIAAPIGEVINVTTNDPSVALYDLEDAWS